MVLFLDEKGPITLKRYGGYRWTTAKRLVLPKYQKTRGKFYLYAIYELFHGRVRWKFYDHNTSTEFICFAQQIRRWYPHQYILLVLDLDTTHPQKCGASRRELRQLKIHWLSLPKGSSDDNPPETIFSVLQGEVLAGSDAPDVPTQKRHISHALWRRNRQPNRFVRLGYLSEFYQE